MRTFIITLLIVIIVGIGAGIGFLTASIDSITNVNTEINPDASSQFFDVNGHLITTTVSAENRIPVKINKIPHSLEQAFLAAEDIRFYEHSGIDPRGIVRAIYSNILSKGVAEGGSTITQQLAKNAFLSQDRNLKRKVQEAILAFKLEQQYSKKEILEMYLNQIYFGQGSYGVEAASLQYFGKHVQDLTLAQSAMLAGIPKSPNYYSPMNNFKASKERQELVLDQMFKYHFITQEEMRKAKAEKIVITSAERKNSSDASYFIDYVSQLVAEKFGADALYKQGLKIYTTLDINMQVAAEAAAKDLPTFSTGANGVKQPQIAIVAIEPKTGYIKAMVGGRGNDQFNRAVLATRQPGSAFKPFVYLAAIESGMNAATLIEDKPVTFAGNWSPSNYSRQNYGWVSLRTALTHSYNIPAVLLADKVSPSKILYYAQQMGISTLVSSGAMSDNNLAMSLGGLTKGVIPLEMANAYAVLANQGVYNHPVAITKIVDRTGKVIYNNKPESHKVVSENSSYILVDMMKSVITSGTGYGANIGRPAAGKTGTTDTYNDAWFVGFTPDISAAVWIGQDEGGSVNMTGADLPATIWRNFMSAAHRNIEVHDFTKPPGVFIPSEPVIQKNEKTDSKKSDTDSKKDNSSKTDKKANSKQTPNNPATTPETPANSKPKELKPAG